MIKHTRKALHVIVALALVTTAARTTAAQTDTTPRRYRVMITFAAGQHSNLTMDPVASAFGAAGYGDTEPCTFISCGTANLRPVAVQENSITSASITVRVFRRVALRLQSTSESMGYALGNKGTDGISSSETVEGVAFIPLLLLGNWGAVGVGIENSRFWRSGGTTNGASVSQSSAVTHAGLMIPLKSLLFIDLNWQYHLAPDVRFEPIIVREVWTGRMLGRIDYPDRPAARHTYTLGIGIRM